MKIALLTNLVAPYRRAAFNALAARAKSVAGSCHVICTDPNETQHIWPTKPVQFHCHPLPGIRVPLGENRRLSFNFGLPRTLSRITPNVLILSGFAPTLWRAQNWAKQHYIPTVLYFDGWHGSDSAYDNIAPKNFQPRVMCNMKSRVTASRAISVSTTSTTGALAITLVLVVPTQTIPKAKPIKLR